MEKNRSDRVSWKPLVGFGILILLLAYLIEKEVSLPQPAILAIAVFGGVALLFSSLVHPEIAMYLLAAYIPFNRILPGDFGRSMTALNLTNILCAVAILGWLSRALQKGGLSNKSSLNFPILLFAFLGGLSLIRGSWEYGAWYILRFIIPLKRWLTPLLLYFLTLFIVQEKRILKTMVLIMMFAVTVVGLMAIKDYIDIGPVSDIDKTRVGGIAEQPNMLAAFFCYYMFILASFFLCNAKKARYWLLLIPFLICFRGIQVTFSRGGYIAFFAGAFALSFFKSRKFFLLTVLLLVIAFMNPVLLPKGIVYRLLSTFQNAEEIDLDGDDLQKISADIYKGEKVILEGSAQRRLEIWRGALKIIADYPLWGTGYGTFASVIPYYTPELEGKQIDAHNSYIIIAAEMGIPALIVFLWILGLVVWKTYRLYKVAEDPFIKATALGFLAGLFGLLVANMFGSRMHSEEISGYFWILAALVVRAFTFEKATKALPVKAPAGTKRRVGEPALATPDGVVVPRSLSTRLWQLDEFKQGDKT